MPHDQDIIGLPGLKVIGVVQSQNLVFDVRCDLEPSCVHCGAQGCRIKASFIRVVRHESMGCRRSILHIRTHKFLCKTCGRYFNERIPGLMPFARATEPFKREVCLKHQEGISQRSLSQSLKIGNATIERWYQKSMEVKIRELNGRDCPKILGIDEHFFTKNKGYATTFVNLQTHRVFDVTLGRSELSLRAYLSKLKGRENVKVVVMDLSSTYRSIVKKYFPNAMIVADRFHVIRLINHHFLKSWQHFDPEGRKNRGLLSLMRRHEWNLSLDQERNLRKYLENEVPVMNAIYDFKQSLCKYMLIKNANHEKVKEHAAPFLKHIEQLTDHPVESLRRLGKTLHAWFDEVVRMWRFTKTNSITEGLHTKMEMISRRAYGFRNFKNYRLRVLVLCG